MAYKKDLRVLVIDDSAYNRRVMADIIEQTPGLALAGTAHDGDEGLQMALREKPDAITLDLEMPRMDGFTFLRLLMAKRPTPVIVISCHTDRDKVFRALELGALDFVAKPTHLASPQIMEIKDEVLKKLQMARASKFSTMPPPPPPACGDEAQPESAAVADRPDIEPDVFAKSKLLSLERPLARRMVAMAASTGGPAALTRILVDLPSDIQAAIAIVQHMPMKFTAAFAERLDSLCQIKVKEAAFAEPLLQGTAYVAPGQSCLEVRKGDIGFTIHAGAPLGNERYLPSADSLFASAAIAMGPDAMAVILTGMGDDGAKGAQAIAAAGGIAVAEDESTAIIPGMPRAAVLSGCVTRIAPLDKLADIIKDFARK